MSKYIDADRLKAEVEKRKEERQDIRDSASWNNEYWPESDFYIRDKEDDDILAIIDFFQQEMWKPSKEQITAVEAAYSVLNSHDTWGEDEHLPTIMSLINDLQKLL